MAVRDNARIMRRRDPFMAPRADIAIMHPFDDRGCACDLWRDINSPDLVVEFAFTLIPKERESNPFVADAVLVVIYSTIVSFMLSGGRASVLRQMAIGYRWLARLLWSVLVNTLIAKIGGQK